MPETVIYYGGIILPMDDSAASPEALAVRDGRIAAMGTFDDMRAFAGSSARMIHLDGAALLPGFYDGHSHFLRAGLYEHVYVDLRSRPVGPIDSIEDIKGILRRRIEETPEGQWIRCHGYDDTALAEKRHITLAELDELSTRHPIYLRHVSGHLAVFNSRALALGGITDSTPAPAGGAIRHDASGRPNGLLEEAAAMDMVLSHMPAPSGDDWQKGLDIACGMYSSRGITTAQDGGVTPVIWKELFRGYARGAVRCRVQLLPLTREDTRYAPDLPPGSSLTPDHMLSLGAFKLVADGSIQGYTGYLSEPYHTLPPDRPSDWRGYPVCGKTALAAEVLKYHSQGRQIAIHGNGDAAIDDILDAFEDAQKALPRTDLRHIVIHAQMAREDQIDRMARLGVVASFFPAHIYYWGDRHLKMFLGPRRAARLDPLHSAVVRSLPFSMHNDTPITPVNPLGLLSSAVNRITFGGTCLGPEQRITVYDGLLALTRYSAWQYHEEHLKGTLTVGKLADFTVLDRNPLDLAPQEIDSLRIRATIVGGRIIYGGF